MKMQGEEVEEHRRQPQLRRTRTADWSELGKHEQRMTMANDEDERRTKKERCVTFSSLLSSSQM
ncbi:hypothetical protein PIB30_088006, partial [Stylosanthes scabra]|nr:hypothetical protein [Stylosanthes scabra]